MAKMSEAAKAARAEYARKWRERNPQRAREITTRFWERKAAEKRRQEEERHE